MKKQVLFLLTTVIFALNIHAQLPKVYNEKPVGGIKIIDKFI